jgi:hypothetical protein
MATDESRLVNEENELKYDQNVSDPDVDDVNIQENQTKEDLVENTTSKETTISSAKEEIPTDRHDPPRPPPFTLYLSPLDTSQLLVVVGYIVVFVAALGTRLYKLNEPDHIWYVMQAYVDTIHDAS